MAACRQKQGGFVDVTASQGREKQMMGTDAADRALGSKLARAIQDACPAWAREHTDTLVSASMQRVQRARRERTTKGPLPASYLWRLALGAAVDTVRDLRSTREVAHRPGEDVEPDVRAALARLGEAKRRMVTLHLLGHAIFDIARILELPAKRVQSGLPRAVARLRARSSRDGIAEYEPEDDQALRRDFMATAPSKNTESTVTADRCWDAQEGGTAEIAALVDRLATDVALGEDWRIAMAFRQAAERDEAETAAEMPIQPRAEPASDDAAAAAPAPGWMLYLAIAIVAAIVLVVVVRG